MRLSHLGTTGWRRVVFWVSMLYLVGLGFLGVAYVADWIHPRHHIGALPTPIFWYGALGAVVLSLTGVFDHAKNWDNSYVLWHIARPFVGAAVALVAVLIFISGILAVGLDPATAKDKTTHDIFYWVLAFIVGYREETFRLLIKRASDVILGPGSTTPGAPAPTITDVTPPTGRGGDVVTITGTALLGTSAVTFGSAPALINERTEIALKVVAPPGSGAVPVSVATPGGSDTGGPFTYEEG